MSDTKAMSGADTAPSGAVATLAHVLVSHQPFGVALTELVREVEDVYATERGLKIATFAEVLPGVSPATLRAAVTGERAPSAQLIEECARFLRVKPEYFREYRTALREAA